MSCEPTDDRSKPGVTTDAQPNAGAIHAVDSQTCITINDAALVSSNRLRDSGGLYLRDSSGAYLTSSV